MQSHINFIVCFPPELLQFLHLNQDPFLVNFNKSLKYMLRFINFQMNVQFFPYYFLKILNSCRITFAPLQKSIDNICLGIFLALYYFIVNYVIFNGSISYLLFCNKQCTIHFFTNNTLSYLLQLYRKFQNQIT